MTAGSSAAATASGTSPAASTRTAPSLHDRSGAVNQTGTDETGRPLGLQGRGDRGQGR